VREIYHLTPSLLNDDEYFTNSIKNNLTNNYYWSDDWSEEFYISLAKAGFISTTYDTKEGLVLLPELQYSYAVLYFKDLHISSKVQKLINKQEYIFSVDTKFDEVLEKISSQHKYNWLKDEYLQLLKDLHKNKTDDNFKLVSYEVSSKENELIAGEVGYIIGRTYTSLTGFSSREKKYNNYGTLQLVLLSKYLEKNNFAFWNLGHPHMEYKKKLGAKVYERGEFMQIWENSILLQCVTNKN